MLPFLLTSEEIKSVFFLISDSSLGSGGFFIFFYIMTGILLVLMFVIFLVIFLSRLDIAKHNSN